MRVRQLKSYLKFVRDEAQVQKLTFKDIDIDMLGDIIIHVEPKLQMGEGKTESCDLYYV